MHKFLQIMNWIKTSVHVDISLGCSAIQGKVQSLVTFTGPIREVETFSTRWSQYFHTQPVPYKGSHHASYSTQSYNISTQQISTHTV